MPGVINLDKKFDRMEDDKLSDEVQNSHDGGDIYSNKLELNIANQEMD